MIGGRLQAGRLPTATTRQLLTSPALKGIIVCVGGVAGEKERGRLGLLKPAATRRGGGGLRMPEHAWDARPWSWDEPRASHVAEKAQSVPCPGGAAGPAPPQRTWLTSVKLPCPKQPLLPLPKVMIIPRSGKAERSGVSGTRDAPRGAHAARGGLALLGPAVTHNVLGGPPAAFSKLPGSSGLDALQQLEKQTSDDRGAPR